MRMRLAARILWEFDMPMDTCVGGWWLQVYRYYVPQLARDVDSTRVDLAPRPVPY